MEKLSEKVIPETLGSPCIIDLESGGSRTKGSKPAAPTEAEWQWSKQQTKESLIVDSQSGASKNCLESEPKFWPSK